jgi:2-oxoglutarate ferredoxin oxidoreductase subunit alpha
MRVGPGLGGILPSQGDYFQATKGGGHGDYHLIVYAPATVQENADLTIKAFNIADKYRNPVMILADGMLGQMMEPVEFKEQEYSIKEKLWATTGCDGTRPKNLINSLYINPNILEQELEKALRKYKFIEQNEVMWEEYNCKDANIIVIAYGTISRIIKSVIKKAINKNIKVGLIRPITLWPFPYEIIYKNALKENVIAFLAVEMSMGQMVEDVKIGVKGKKPVFFKGKLGGLVPTTKEILQEIEYILGELL